MFFLSLSIWCVVVYSFRVGLCGNPLYLILRGRDPAFIRRLDNGAPGAAAETAFLRRFSLLMLIETGAFVIELAVIGWCLWQRVMPWLAWLLLAKDFGALAASIAVTRRHGDGGAFAALLELPRWLVWLDRGSALVSGAGFVVLLFEVNGMWPLLAGLRGT